MVVKTASLHRRSPGSIPQKTEMLLTGCQEIGACRQRDRWDMRLCADNCVAGLLVGCFNWVVNQDGVCIDVCWRSAICEGGPECGQLSSACTLAVWWAQASEDVVGFRSSLKQMS